MGMHAFPDWLGAGLRAMAVVERPVAPGVAAEEVELAAVRAVPVGLVVSEPVTNAVKHAFPGGRARSVSVRLHRSGKGRLRLEAAAGGTGGRHTVAAMRGGLGDDRGGREEAPRERKGAQQEPPGSPGQHGGGRQDRLQF